MTPEDIAAQQRCEALRLELLKRFSRMMPQLKSIADNGPTSQDAKVCQMLALHVMGEVYSTAPILLVDTLKA